MRVKARLRAGRRVGYYDLGRIMIGGIVNRLVCVVLAALLAGCVAKYRVDSLDKPKAELSSQSSFYVILPTDGAYGGQTYAGSGTSTAQAVASALLRHVQSVETGTQPAENLPTAIAHAKQRGLRYVFQPVILHWEDRATEWSGITDKVEFKFSVFDVATGQAVSSSVVHASTKWASFGGDHPQDLLPETARSYVDQLF